MCEFASTAPKVTISIAAGGRHPDVSAGMNAVASVLFVLLVLLAVPSCARVPTAKDLGGMWVSQSAVTQPGAASETFCFGNDGSVQGTSQVQGRTTRFRGTYKIAGNMLTIQSPDLDTTATLRANLSLGKLELTSPNGSTQKYTKVPGSCDDNGR